MNLVDHLIDRGMDPSLYQVVYDDYEQVITFYLYNFAGKIVGYQQYRPGVEEKKKKNDPKNGRYFTYLKNHVDGVWGLEVLDNSKRTVYVVEGIFKAAVLHRLGYNAIATLTATPKRLKPLFKILKSRYDFVAIGDPDKAGQMLVNIIKRGECSPLDIDEMRDEEIIKFIEGMSND